MACADEVEFSDSVSQHELLKSLSTDLLHNDTGDYSETTKDYVYVLQNSPGTVQSKLQKILDLNDQIKSKKPAESLRFSDVVPLLKDFRDTGYCLNSGLICLRRHPLRLTQLYTYSAH